MGRRAATALAAVALLVGFGFVAYRSLRGPGAVAGGNGGAVALRYAMPDGTRRVFAVESVSDVRIDVAAIPLDPRQPPVPGPAQVAALQSAFSGDLRVRLYRDGEAGWNVAAWLEPSQILVAGRTPSWAWALGNPFSFHLAPRGMVDRLTFTPLLPMEARSFLGRLAAGLQATIPEVLQDAWTSREELQDGVAEVAYARISWDPAASALVASRSVRNRALRERPGPDVPFLASMAIDVASSSGQVHTSMAGWIAETRTVDEVAFLSDGKRWAVGRKSFSARTVEKDAGKFPASFAEFAALQRSQAYIETAFGRTDPELDRLAEGLDTEGALERYLRTRGKDKAAAERFLVNYLRKNERAPTELLRAIDRDLRMARLDETTQLVLWRLVIEAGTPAAQRAVMAAASDPGYHHGSHVRAIMYASGFENPQPFLVEGMMDLHRDPSAVSKGDPLGSVENMSLLAVGSLGHREKLDEDTRAAAARALSGNLERARGNRAETALTLTAIGNSGNDALLDTVKPYLDSPEEQVRTAACESMRRMDSPAAQEQLIQAYGQDRALPVRESALRALAQTPVNPATASWAREAVLVAPTPSDTVGLVNLLGKTLVRYPHNDEALRALLATNPPEPVKDAVYRYVAPR